MKQIQKWLMDNGFQVSNAADKVTELVKNEEYVYVHNEIKSDVGDIFIHPKHKLKQLNFNLVSGIIKRKDINLHSGLTKFPKNEDSSQHKGIKFGFLHKQAFNDFLLIFLTSHNVLNEKFIVGEVESSPDLTRNASSKNKFSVDEKTWQEIKTRRGQPKFRQDLLSNCNGKCRVTDCNVESVLEAAHIIPHSEASNYSVLNGLLLRADIHTLYDLNLIGIDGNGKVFISETLRESKYWQYQGKIIATDIHSEMSANLAKRFELFSQTGDFN
jgi:hypothetical protein